MQRKEVAKKRRKETTTITWCEERRKKNAVQLQYIMRSLIIYHQRCIAHFFSLRYLSILISFDSFARCENQLGGAALVLNTHENQVLSVIFCFFRSVSVFLFLFHHLVVICLEPCVSSENDLFSMLIAHFQRLWHFYRSKLAKQAKR